jgi:hypothetical protein
MGGKDRPFWDPQSQLMAHSDVPGRKHLAECPVEFSGKNLHGKPVQVSLVSHEVVASSNLLAVTVKVRTPVSEASIRGHLTIDQLYELNDALLTLLQGNESTLKIGGEEGEFTMQFYKSADGVHLRGKAYYGPRPDQDENQHRSQDLATGIPFPRSVQFSLLLKVTNLETALSQLKDLLEVPELGTRDWEEFL